MNATISHMPRPAAWRRKGGTPMDIVMHLGAHRTASTCFQHYLRENSAKLGAQGIAVWGPWRTRDGLLTGVMPVAGVMRSAKLQLQRARGRIALAQHRAKNNGMRQLIVSDENMIGAPRRNLRDSKLYAGAGERMARYSEAFDNKVSRVVLSIRSQDSYWSSALAFSVGQGHRLPDTDALDRLVTSNRHWRDVIRDLYCALPNGEILVMPYEEFGGRPEEKLSCLAGLASPPMKSAREWINRSPSVSQLRQILHDRGEDPAALPKEDGRWHPFDHAQTMALKESYADDLFWLRAGADGMATLIEETGADKMGITPQQPQMTRGQNPNGIENRRMA